MGFRLYRRKSLGRGLWLGLSKSGRASVGAGGAGPCRSVSAGAGGSVRLMKGLSYVFGEEAMKGLLLALALSTVLALAALAFGYSAGPAAASAAHRNPCHTRHECPSDHATYRWGPKRLLCVKPTSSKRNATFRKRIRYGGLTYYCKR